MAEAAGSAMILRLCLDLNVWISDFLGHRRRAPGLRLPASQRLVQAAIDGRYEAIPVQIIVSWGMLDRLRAVLAALAGDDTIAERLIDDIVQWAQLIDASNGAHLWADRFDGARWRTSSIYRTRCH